MVLDIEDVSEPSGPRSRQNVAMRLLAAGIPLSLLIDLTAPDGPDSTGIIASEQPDSGRAVH